MPKLRHSRGLPIEQIAHIDLTDMPDVAGINSDHDARYYTQAQLNSTIAPSGASLIGVQDIGAFFVGADVEAILQEIAGVILPGAYLRLDGTNVPTANYNWTTNLTTIGTLQGATVTGTTSVIASTMTLATGSITDSTGAISFDNENLTTTGTGTFNEIKATGSGLIWADGTTGTTPTSGAGTRFMWIPAKSAFRFGTVMNTEWDDANIGQYSYAGGFGSIASGTGAIALGNNSTASGSVSVAMGRNSVAGPGSYSTAIGRLATASGQYDIAIGYNLTASGGTSIAFGSGFTNSTANSFGIGFGQLDYLFTATAADFYNSSITTTSTIYNKADNSKHYFGAGDDVSFYYDATNFNIDTDLVAPSDLIIDCGTAKTLVLEVPVYNDINIAGYLLGKPASNYPGTDTFRTSTPTDTGIETYAFAVDEKVHGGFELMHDYKEGTDLVFHVHFQIIAVPSGTDNVQWRLAYVVMRDGVTLTAVTTIDSADTPVDTQYRAYRTDFGAITGTNFKIGDQFMFTLTRVAPDGDVFLGDCLIETAGIHYQIDTLGSRNIITK